MAQRSAASSGCRTILNIAVPVAGGWKGGSVPAQACSSPELTYPGCRSAKEGVSRKVARGNSGTRAAAESQEFMS
jgi:hypothetical protein